MSLHLETIPNRSSPPAILLREARRDGARIVRRTIANLSKLPPVLIDGLKALIRGGIVVNDLDKAVIIQRSLPHGNVNAVLGFARKLGLERILAYKADRRRDLALAAIVARMVQPCSKLATARSLSFETAVSSLNTVMSLGQVTEQEMLAMLDWLVKRQSWIERSLAKRHLGDHTMILYDVSSSYVEGRSCPLAAFGHNREGKKGKKQITYGLLCATDGCPVAVEVFAGNTSDPMTLKRQIDKIRRRFNLRQVAMVGDRGMITTARIRDELQPLALDWISAFKSSDIRQLLREAPNQPAALSPAQIKADEVVEITSPDYPSERLIVCLNPRLKAERARKREDLLRDTEKILEKIARLIRQPGSRLQGRDRIFHRLGREANRRRVEKHFLVTVTDRNLSWARNEQSIAEEARLDGLYVVRTSLQPEDLSSHKAVEAYKSLSRVERAFRALKTTSLQIRPIYVCTEPHVRGHVFLGMLAWYVEWHMRQRLAPLLFQDDDPESARSKRSSPVPNAKVSASCRKKNQLKRAPDRRPIHSMRTLLNDLATLNLHWVTLPSNPDHPFTMTTKPTTIQKKVFELLEIEPPKNVAMYVAD